MNVRGCARGLFVAVGVVADGCVGDSVGGAPWPLDAFCTATVEGIGEVDVESDYLPRVVQCENGAAADAALQVQAIAARSYLYYKLERSGSITDGTSDQVYSCGRPPSERHYAAVRATSGLVLRFRGSQVAAFYVAGALQSPPDCRGGTDDPTRTERFVTYNEGRRGDDVIQTSLGWVHPSNHANRGCMSQNGSHCLAQMGWDAERILRFYYGEDIEIVRAEGACVTPPDMDPPSGPDASVEADAGAVGGDGGWHDDAGTVPPTDGGLPGSGDAAGPAVHDGGRGRNVRSLSGGCSTTLPSAASAVAWLVAMPTWIAARRRTRRARRDQPRSDSNASRSSSTW
ncbi:MAG: hypothetical protein NZ898_03065 [Myxococcota bacterium]|nr:hypothetical protein [Myxococcota bacterium]MDW8361004.1 SpoIID/LytB domain-containing protein [Myxococcales bacterium]